MVGPDHRGAVQVMGVAKTHRLADFKMAVPPFFFYTYKMSL